MSKKGTYGKVYTSMLFLMNWIVAINPLQPGVLFLYPLKISENLKVF